MVLFGKWKKVYLDLLNYHNDLSEEFKEIFPPKIFSYNKREAFLFFSGLTLAMYAILAKNINRDAQNKFALFQLDGIFQHFCSHGKPTMHEISEMLEERQNELIEIISKSISGENNAKEALERMTEVVFKNVFDNDKDQYEIVYPLLFSTLGKYMDKALNAFNR
jgi:hypothetical protein